MSEQEQREYNESRALDVLADDGHGSAIMVPLPRRPGAGLSKPKSRAQLKRELFRNSVPFARGQLIEVLPDVYVDSERDAILLSTQDDGEYQVICLYVEKPRGKRQ